MTTKTTTTEYLLPFSLMLAKKWDNSIDPTNWLISEKLDGMRAFWSGSELITRQGKLIHTPQWFKNMLPDFALDGELYLGRGKFQETVSITRRQDKSDDWFKIKYYIFDAPTISGGFETRLQKVKDWITLDNPSNIEFTKHYPCKDLSHLLSELQSCLESGGEGLMLRNAGSSYKHGRSSDLLKVKIQFDSEAKVIGYTKGTGKYNSFIGALQVVFPDGKQFKVGSGLTDKDRQNPPEIGSIITFKYQELTNDGIPRFASFDRIRKDVDWETVKQNYLRDGLATTSDIKQKVSLHKNTRLKKKNSKNLFDSLKTTTAPPPIKRPK